MKRFRLFRCFAVFSAALLLAVTFAGCGDQLLDYAPENADIVAVFNGSRIAAQPQINQMIRFLTMTAPGFDGRLDRELARAGINANDFKNEYMLFYCTPLKSGGVVIITPDNVAPKLFQALRQIYRSQAREIEIDHLPGVEITLPDNRGILQCVQYSNRRLELAWGSAPQLPLSGGHRNPLAQKLDAKNSLLHLRIAPAALLERNAKEIPPFLTKLKVLSCQFRSQNGILTQDISLEFPAAQYAYEAKGAAETLFSTFSALLPFNLPLRLEHTQFEVNGSDLVFSGQLGRNRYIAAVPAPSRRAITSASNLKRLAAACASYAQDNDGFWPPSLDELRATGLLTDPALLLAPNDLSTPPAPPEGPFLAANSSYVYLAGNFPGGLISAREAHHYPVAFEKPEFQPTAESAILWMDGDVTYLKLNTSNALEVLRQLRLQQPEGEEKYWKQLEANAAAYGK